MIHIVTVYDSLNYGSYFQALALRHYAQKFDKADYLDVHHQNLKKDTLRLVLRYTRRRKFKMAADAYAKYRVFRKKHKAFELTDLSAASEDDLFIFGSDEIWNLDREKMKQSREFFGVGLPGKNKIAYAPSVNTTSLETFKQNPYCKQALDDFAAVSVRDSSSQQVIGALLGREIPLVVDPTLLVARAFYEEIMDQRTIPENTLMIYSYGAMLKKPGVKQKIVDFARKHSLTIVSVGQSYDFADENVMATPEEFLRYVADAKYIITDTFHGSIFSIIFRKNFAAYDVSNQKVNALLDDYRLSDRMIDEAAELDGVFEHAPDYTECEQLLSARQSESQQYLDQSILSLRNGEQAK